MNPIGTDPILNALSIPTTQQMTVMQVAACHRLIFSSSESSEVPISCIEIVEVSAANVSREKKSIATP